MNILFTSPRGSWQRDKRLQKGLEESGHSVDQTSSIFENIAISRSKMRSFIIKYDKNYISVIVITLWVCLDIISQLLILIVNIKKIHRAEILYSENTSCYSVFATKIFGILFNKTVVYDPHGGMYYGHVVGRKIIKPDSVIAKIWHQLDSYAANICDVYILGSHAQKNHYKNEFSIDLSKICVIYTGADEERFDPNTVPTNKEINFLYWGSFIGFHRTDLIIDAAKKVDHISFVLAGEGNSPEAENRRQKLMNIVERRNIKNVEFVGYIHQSTLEQYIASSDLVAGYYSENPKINLTISNKVGEAAYMEKTIVSARSPALEEVFTHNNSIVFCDPDSSKDLAEQIKQYYKKDTNIIGKNARGIYDTYLSSSAAAEAFIHSIKNCENRPDDPTS